MSWCANAVNEFFEYDTPHIVHIKSKKIGIFSRFIQLGVLAYIIGYVIVTNKGYQVFSTINSSVTSKLKGVAVPNFTNDQLKVPYNDAYKKVFDVADYVVPPQENGAFFVMTNMVITPNQSQGICPEDSNLKQAHCSIDEDCVANQSVVNGNGIMTGKCVMSSTNITVCQIKSWCPLEVNVLPLGPDLAILTASKNFTVLIKNSVEFPLFNIRRRNILNSSNSSYLESCHYDPVTDPSCPIFKLDTIVSQAGEKYDEVAVQGGVIAIVINWECNLDFNPEMYCNPTYRFRRLDDPYAKIAKGWNFRYANYYSDDLRTLYKAFGIRFVVLVEGRAGRFNIVPLMLNIGSGLALLGLSTVICDIIVLYVHKKRNYFNEKKYIQVGVSDDDEMNTRGSSYNYEPIRRLSATST
ncbi:hypothetical protein CHUAL_005717 [Chamberlinius hualienensis]